EGERDAQRVERAAVPTAAEQRHTGEREDRPHDGDAPPRGQYGERERTEDLEGDGRPERDPLDRAVERRVHPRQRHPEAGDEEQVAAGASAQGGAEDGEEQDGRDRQPEGDDAERTDAREEEGREGGPELGRPGGGEDEDDRRDPLAR